MPRPALQVALSKLVLKRFLLLVALLDRAAQLPGGALPGGAPLLFRVDAKLKASAQVGWQPGWLTGWLAAGWGPDSWLWCVRS